jgi:hypothetical protein
MTERFDWKPIRQTAEAARKLRAMAEGFRAMAAGLDAGLEESIKRFGLALEDLRFARAAELEMMATPFGRKVREEMTINGRRLAPPRPRCRDFLRRKRDR